MTTTPTTTADADVSAQSGEEPRDDEALVQDDLLVEDVSIDGMCGVY